MRPDDGFFGRAFTLGPSLDGGFDEFLEDFANASFSAASSACNAGDLPPKVGNHFIARIHHSSI